MAAGVLAATLGMLHGPSSTDQTAEVFVCDGGETTIFTAGRNGWIDGVKYQAVSSSVEGTLTPRTATRADQRDQGVGRGQGRQPTPSPARAEVSPSDRAASSRFR